MNTSSFISNSYALINNPVLSTHHKQLIQAAITQGREIVKILPAKRDAAIDAEFEALLKLCGKLSGFLFRHYD